MFSQGHRLFKASGGGTQTICTRRDLRDQPFDTTKSKHGLIESYESDLTLHGEEEERNKVKEENGPENRHIKHLKATTKRQRGKCEGTLQ